MTTRTSAGRLLAGLGTVLLLAGCVASAGGTAAPATPSAAATASPTAPSPSPSAVPSAATGRTLVSGTVRCPYTDPMGLHPYPTPEKFSQGLELEWFDFTCTYAMSDSRVSGTERYIYRGGVQGMPDMDAAVFVWDSVPLVLETPGGTWKGIGAGVDYLHGKGYTFAHATYQGQGAYAGLTYWLTFFREADGSQTDDPYLVSGWIEPSK